MNYRNILTASLGLALTLLVAFGGPWQSAAAGARGIYPLHAGETIELGKQGLFASNLPVGVSYVYADVMGEPLLPRFNQNVDIAYRAPPMEVRFLNRNGGTVEDINALVYVFFNIGKAERWLWLEGGMDEIAIWYVNERTNRWELCPTYYVNENRDNGMFDRLSCVAPGSGYYVLGYIDFDRLLFNPYTFNNERVVDFARRFIPY